MWPGKKRQNKWLTVPSLSLPSYKKRQHYVKVFRESATKNLPLGGYILLGILILYLFKRLIKKRQNSRRRWEGNNFAQLMRHKHTERRRNRRQRRSKQQQHKEEEGAAYIDVISIFAQTKTPPKMIIRKNRRKATEKEIRIENKENTRQLRDTQEKKIDLSAGDKAKQGRVPLQGKTINQQEGLVSKGDGLRKRSTIVQ